MCACSGGPNGLKRDFGGKSSVGLGMISRDPEAARDSLYGSAWRQLPRPLEGAGGSPEGSAELFSASRLAPDCSGNQLPPASSRLGRGAGRRAEPSAEPPGAGLDLTVPRKPPNVSSCPRGTGRRQGGTPQGPADLPDQLTQTRQRGGLQGGKLRTQNVARQIESGYPT